jgi:hypothetical protein
MSKTATLVSMGITLALALVACAGDEKPTPSLGQGGAGQAGSGQQAGGAPQGAGAGPAQGGTGQQAQGGTGQQAQGGAGPATGAVAINEIDPNGSPADWVELVNLGSAAVDLQGWSVTQGYDDAVMPTGNDAAALPPGSVIQPGGHLVVFTSNDLDAGSFPGAFGISKSKAERISLFDPAGSLVDDTTTDGSKDAPFSDGTTWARVPDGTGPFGRHAGTQGESNAP